MKNNVIGVNNPTAAIAINKSRLKQYDKSSDAPTYYLQKGQEFQLELFNPTTGNVLCKIELNGKLISQTGLVLRPGMRYFLDRYIDIDKKFLFDTYEVSNSKQVKEAIKNNGDIKILFFKEKEENGLIPFNDKYFYYSNPNNYSDTGTFINLNAFNTTSFASNANSTSTGFYSTSISNNEVTLNKSNKLRSKLRSTKSIETGRVEKGSQSNQSFDKVDMSFEYSPFHTVSYKLLPQSQKLVEAKTLHKKYCTNCGGKVKPKDKFCSKCGNKI